MSEEVDDRDSEIGISSRVLLDAIPHVTLVLDANKRILHANRAAVSSFGMSLPELRTRHCGELLPFDIACEEEPSPGQQVICSPMIDGDGVASHYLLMMRDTPSADSIHEEDSLHRLLFQTSPDEVLYIDRWGKVVDVNSRIYDLFGIRPEHAIGKRVTYFAKYAKISVDTLLELFRKVALGTYSTEPIEMECIHEDGHCFFVEFNATRVLREGKLAGLQVIVRDVTERRQNAAKVRESEQLFQQMLNAVSDMVTVIDRDHNIIYSNWHGFAEVPEHRRVLPAKCFRAYRNLEAPCPDCRAFDVFDTGRPLYVETRVGEGPWLDLQASPLYDAEGKVKYVVEWVRDVTPIKQYEQELRASEERLALALAATNDGLWDWNVQTGEAYFSPRYYTMLGYEPNEMPSGFETWRSLLHPEDLPVAEQLVAAHIDGKKPGFVVEFRMKTKDGGWRWVLGRGKVVERDDQGRPIRMVGTHTDISDRKLAEQEKASLQDQLIQAQKMESIGRLAGGVAHDFNNLLTSISGNAELTLMDLSENDPLRESIEEIGKAGRSAANLTRQLLAFSRKQIIEPKVLNINEVVAGSHRMLKRLIGEDVDLLFLPSSDLGGVRMDPGQLEQIVVNLVVNARDAMPEGGKLTLESGNVRIEERNWSGKDVLEVGEYVMLAVSDTGVGMGEEVLQHLFEPFFTTKGKGKGTGLGLATVYGAVKQNEGTVRVYSELGQGTTFKLYFPRVHAEPDPVRPPKDDALPEGKETIVVVEDEDAVRALAVRVLERQGYGVLAFANGEEAVMAVEESTRPIHLLLTDVIMPGMNGKILADKVRILRPGIRVLFTSGYTENAIAHHGVLDEGIRFISKPYAPRSLARKVRDVLDEPDRDRSRTE
jgi:PAS domain S-box-containing protein